MILSHSIKPTKGTYENRECLVYNIAELRERFSAKQIRDIIQKEFPFANPSIGLLENKECNYIRVDLSARKWGHATTCGVYGLAYFTNTYGNEEYV